MRFCLRVVLLLVLCLCFARALSNPQGTRVVSSISPPTLSQSPPASASQAPSPSQTVASSPTGSSSPSSLSTSISLDETSIGAGPSTNGTGSTAGAAPTPTSLTTTALTSITSSVATLVPSVAGDGPASTSSVPAPSPPTSSSSPVPPDSQTNSLGAGLSGEGEAPTASESPPTSSLSQIEPVLTAPPPTPSLPAAPPSILTRTSTQAPNPLPAPTATITPIIASTPPSILTLPSIGPAPNPSSTSASALALLPPSSLPPSLTSRSTRISPSSIVFTSGGLSLDSPSSSASSSALVPSSTIAVEISSLGSSSSAHLPSSPLASIPDPASTAAAAAPSPLPSFSTSNSPLAPSSSTQAGTLSVLPPQTASSLAASQSRSTSRTNAPIAPLADISCLPSDTVEASTVLDQSATLAESSSVAVPPSSNSGSSLPTSPLEPDHVSSSSAAGSVGNGSVSTIFPTSAPVVVATDTLASTLRGSVVRPAVLSSASAVGVASSPAAGTVANSSPEVPLSPTFTSQDASTTSPPLSTSPIVISTATNLQPALLPALPDSDPVPESDKPIPMRFTRLPITLAQSLTVPTGPFGPSSSSSSHKSLPSPQTPAQVAKAKKIRTLTVAGALAAVAVLAGIALALTLGRKLICLRVSGVMTGRRTGVGDADGMSERGEDGDVGSIFRPAMGAGRSTVSERSRFSISPFLLPLALRPTSPSLARGSSQASTGAATSGSIYSHLSTSAPSAASISGRPLRTSLPSPVDELRTLALPAIARRPRTSDGSTHATSGSISSFGPSGLYAVASVMEASSLSEPGSGLSRPPSFLPELGFVSHKNESEGAKSARSSVASCDYREGQAQAVDPFSDAGGFEWVILPEE